MRLRQKKELSSRSQLTSANSQLAITARRDRTVIDADDWPGRFPDNFTDGINWEWHDGLTAQFSRASFS
jgi:hypothetical protein